MKQHIGVISYRLLGTTYPFLLHESNKIGLISCVERLVINYHHMLCSIAEEHISQDRRFYEIKIYISAFNKQLATRKTETC